MPRASGIKQLIAPSAGLVTEQSKLAPAEGSTVDELNFTYNDDGSIRRRRYGLNKEDGASFYSLTEAVTDTSAASYGMWEAVGGDGDINLHVFQISSVLHFVKDTSGNLTDQIQTFTYELDDMLAPAFVTTEDTPVSLTSGEGRLFVVGRKIEPFYIDYDPDTDTISSTAVNLQVRDMTGLDDGYEVDFRPLTTLTEEHDYNLNNQGWWQTRRTTAGGSFVDPVAEFESTNGAYPSNADIALLGMVDDGDGNLIYDPDYLLELTLGNTPAAKGHFIINPFNIPYDALRTGTDTGGGGWGDLVGTGGGTGTGSTIVPPSWWDDTVNPSYEER